MLQYNDGFESPCHSQCCAAVTINVDKHLRQIIKWKFRPQVATYSPFPITVSGVGSHLNVHTQLPLAIICRNWKHLPEMLRAIAHWWWASREKSYFMLLFTVQIFLEYVFRNEGFPGHSVVKIPPADVGGMSSISGSGRFLGEGNGIPLWYSCLENPMDRGAWWAAVHGVEKDLDMT